ncbi:MAG TPA: hypothetical protein VGE67_12045 [Haloferula sp.]
MTRHSPWLSGAVFAVSLAVTLVARNSASRSGLAKDDPPSGPPARPTKVHREQSAFEEVKERLRAGDFEGAKGILRQLGERDPVAFFELLERLPGMPGIDDIIGETAARLPWNQPEITDLLNRIGTNSWRDLAWSSYTAARIGLRPDEEVFEVGIKARSHEHLSGVRKLMEDAAEKRPDRFLALLNHLGGTSIREEYFEMLMKHHSSRAGEFFATIPDGSPGANYDRAYVLQARARCVPTAESLIATLADTGSRGIYSADFAPLFTHQTYRAASPEEREKVLAAIAEQPPIARNRMVDGLFFDDKPLPIAEFSRATSLYASGYLQRAALERWIKAQPELATADRSWIEQLPTEKMRARAHELLGSKTAADSR